MFSQKTLLLSQIDTTAEVLLAHLYSTNLAINKTALSTLPIITKNSSFQQLECLYSCLDSIKSWFDVFFRIPPGDYIGFPFSIFSQLSHCLITLYKLSSLDDPSWPKAEVRKTADILSILDMAINNLAQVSSLAGLDRSNFGEDIFTRTAMRFRSIRVGWEATLDADVVAATGAARSTVDANPPYDFSVEFPESEWPADDWLTDILMSMRT
ncbi:hypothetical protein B0O99DRAFT_686658 [Bisporella sp. PMI_857]|nr:hypothetical protein B0O99DRAFT_686658 [Bisporella sp. PMI_857]